MFYPTPILAKQVSSQKKKIHIHFDEKEDLPTEEGDQASITGSVVKRQNKLMQEEKHERIIKKSKKNDQAGYDGNRFIQVDYKKISDFTTIALSPKRAEKDVKKVIEESETLFESKTLQLLKELLFHPNRQNRNIINCQIANKWILDNSSPLKIKSFLILYMILYQFESIQFRFRFKRSHFPNTKDPKIISIEKLQKQMEPTFINDPMYLQFKDIEMQKYISDYLEWLILQNYDKFQVGEENTQFWAMALNNCEQVAAQLIQNKNPRERNRNVFLSLFLMNAQDLLFRSSLQIPGGQKIIRFMLKQDLQVLPKCHWVLGTNFSVKYFFKKKFKERVKESLNPNNIEDKQIKEFQHEYRLFCDYFDQALPEKSEQKHKNGQKTTSLADYLIEWILIESGCNSKNTLKNGSHNKNLSRQICTALFQKAAQNSKNQETAQKYILMVVQLLERQSLLSIKQKDAIISDILYKNQGIASKLGKSFPKIINKLEHIKQTQMPKLFQRLTLQYNNLYKHLLLSQQPAIKNDLLAQLKHLIDINIDIRKQDLSVKERIDNILSSFNLITHWNKEVLKSFVYLLERYIQKINISHFDQEISKAKIEEEKDQMEEKEEKESESKREIKELNNLCTFLKIHLRIQPLNLKNLVSMIQFINEAKNNTTIIKFETRTVGFMKRDILSSLFSKNEFNESLFSKIKKLPALNSERIIKEINAEQVNKSQIQSMNILDELATLSKGVKYFEDQVEILKQQASLMTSSQ